MPRNSIFLLMGAVLLGLIAVFSVRTYLTASPQPLHSAPTPVVTTSPVIVAAAPIEFGTKLTKEMFHEAQLPAAIVPDGSFKAMDDVIGKGDRRALRRIGRNEVILASAVSGASDRLSTSGMIDAGKRAAAVKLSDVAGVGGLVQPGDRVDVMVTRTVPNSAEVFTDLLFQNVRVLALDQDSNLAREGDNLKKVPTSATIEVTVAQAQKLALAQITGTVSLALRSVADLAPLPSRTIHLTDLNEMGTARSGAPAPPPRGPVVAAARPRGPQVTVFHGTEPRNVAIGDASAWTPTKIQIPITPGM